MRFARTKPFDAEEMAKARKAMKPMAKWNVEIYEKTNGLIGSRWRVGRKFLVGVPVCILTTTGRKSGQPRKSPLLFLRDGRDIVVVASQGGMPRHPDWYFNVTANPDVEVRVKGEVGRYVARTADAAERARLWPMLVKLYPGFEAYQGRAVREIPVVICSPAG